MDKEKKLHAHLANKAKKAFEKANPSRYGKAQRAPEAVASLRTIETRADHIKKKMRSHFKRSQHVWIAREAIEVWRKRAALKAKHPAPFNIMSESLTSQSIMREAKRRVQARMTVRLSKVNGVQTRMQNAVLKNRQFRERDRNLRPAQRDFNHQSLKMKRSM